MKGDIIIKAHGIFLQFCWCVFFGLKSLAAFFSPEDFGGSWGSLLSEIITDYTHLVQSQVTPQNQHFCSWWFWLRVKLPNWLEDLSTISGCWSLLNVCPDPSVVFSCWLLPKSFPSNNYEVRWQTSFECDTLHWHLCQTCDFVNIYNTSEHFTTMRRPTTVFTVSYCQVGTDSVDVVHSFPVPRSCWTKIPKNRRRLSWWRVAWSLPSSWRFLPPNPTKGTLP